MTINITVDAEDSGKQANFAFTWEGTRAELLRTREHVETMAARQGVTPQSLALEAIRHLPAMGVLEEEGPREVQMMLLAYAALDLAETSGEMPAASVLDLVEHQDIHALLKLRDRKLTAQISGTPILDS